MDNVNAFCALVHCSAETAKKYLQMTGNVFEKAVDLYFSSVTTSTPPPSIQLPAPLISQTQPTTTTPPPSILTTTATTKPTQSTTNNPLASWVLKQLLLKGELKPLLYLLLSGLKPGGDGGKSIVVTKGSVLETLLVNRQMINLSDPLRCNDKVLSDLAGRLLETLCANSTIKITPENLGCTKEDLLRQQRRQLSANCLKSSKDNRKYEDITDGTVFPLIYVDQGEIIVNDDVLQQLGGLDIPITVVASVGKIRTFKSATLNKIFLEENSPKQFVLHHHATSADDVSENIVQARVVLDHNQEGKNIMVLDFCGFGGSQDDDVAARLFALAVLLSDTVIYHGLHKIDAEELSTMQFVAEVVKLILLPENENDNHQGPTYLPSLLWALHGFHLELGEFANEDEYLKGQLKQVMGFSKKVKEQNDIRSAFKKSFSEIKCVTLPAVEPHKETSQYCEKFRKLTEILSEFNRNKNQIGKGGNWCLSHFAELLGKYLQAMKRGTPITMQQSYLELSTSVCQKAKNDALSWFSLILKVQTESCSPLKPEQFKQATQLALSTALQRYNEKAFGEMLNSVKEELKREIGTVEPEPSGLIGEFYQQWQEELLIHFREKMDHYCRQLETHFPELGNNDDDQELVWIVFESLQAHLLHEFEEACTLASPYKELICKELGDRFKETTNELKRTHEGIAEQQREVQVKGDYGYALELEEKERISLRDEHIARSIREKEDAEEHMAYLKREMEKTIAQKRLEMATATEEARKAQEDEMRRTFEAQIGEIQQKINQKEQEMNNYKL